MAAALISRTPQRLLSILEGANEDRTSSLASSGSSKDAAPSRSGQRPRSQAPLARLKTILDQPTWGRGEELGRADSPRMKGWHGGMPGRDERLEGRSPVGLIAHQGATDAVVDMYAAALALKDVANAKEKINQALLRIPIVVGRNVQSDYQSLADALKTVVRGKQVVIYLTDTTYHEKGPLVISGDVRLQADPGSAVVPSVVISDCLAGFHLSHSSSFLHAKGVAFKQSAPAQVGVKPLHVVSKPLIHPPVAAHAIPQPGFGSASATQARCFQVERGRVLLEACSVTSVAGDGVVVGSAGHLEMEGGEVVRCGGDGVAVSDGGQVRNRHAGFEGNGRCGCVAYGAGSSVSMEGCNVQGNGWSGAAVDGGATLVMHGGSLSKNGHAGLHVQAAGSTAHVTSCVVGQNRKHGVSVDACNMQRGPAHVRGEADALLQMKGQGAPQPRHCKPRHGGAAVSVTDSQLKGNGKCGVRVKGPLAGCEATDCRVEENAEEGLAARDGGRVVANGCQVSRNRRAGAMAGGAGASVRLSKCAVLSGDYGVIAQEGEVKVHRCRVVLNLRADREERGAGRVVDVDDAERDEQWVQHDGGRPPTVIQPPPWLADMPKTNTMRTWHGF